MARPKIDLGRLHAILENAKQNGRANIDNIITQFAIPRGWPADLARQYLTRNLQFDIGERELQSIQQFHQIAAHEGIIPAARPLEVFEG
jgi:predicted solute-binding protein